MSRLTSAQVISLGEYLEPDFNPASLTVSQLLGVLGYHNIKYPTPYTKSKLIQLFNDEIKSKAPKLQKERRKKTNSIASDDGITDGLTGKPLGKAPVTRRSSRRLSKIPSTITDDEHETSPARGETTKRRRSSAQPALGGATSRRKTRIEVVPIQEDESEIEELPVKKVGRPKKTTDSAGTHARRISVGDDSGWEDNNIFQSGAEDSSPARPSPARVKSPRKSTVIKKSRKSLSAPPHVSPPSSPMRGIPRSPHALFPQAPEFKPDLPSIPIRDLRFPNQPPIMEQIIEGSQEIGESSKPEIDEVHESEPELTQVEVQPEEAERAERLESHERQDLQGERKAVSRRIAETVHALERRTPPAVPPDRPSWLARLIFVGLISVLAYYVHDYKVQSAAIGYCEAGTRTSRALEEVKMRHLAARECNRENRTTLFLVPSADSENRDLTPCPLPPLLPLPQPETCTPCPEHASCSQFNVVCDNGYLLHPNPLLAFLPTPPPSADISITTASTPTEYVWGGLSDALNGLPGLGSIAFPPRCLEDPKRKENIGKLGRAIETLLAKERGKRICMGGKVIKQQIKESDGGEAKKWGIEISVLKETMRRKTPIYLLPAFDDTFNEAIQQLMQWGGVVFGEDQSGTRYLAHKSPEFTWECAITVKAREAWTEWKPTVFAAFMAVLGTFLARIRYIRKRAESRRVGELVQIALDTLRNQEIAHHTDPVTAPQPYLSSLQLRDLVLQDEHSIPVRRRLWDRVEKVVEGNANVRVNMEEVEGGDELRVWRWVGSSSRGRLLQNDVPSHLSSPLASPGKSDR